MTDPRGALAHLVHTLSLDGDLSDADLALIHDAAVAETNRIVAARTAADRFHVADTPHRPVITVDEAGGEHVDASAMVCGDCGRDLVSDAGTTRVLVCPAVHGKRPPTLRPRDPDGAVYCGG